MQKLDQLGGAVLFDDDHALIGRRHEIKMGSGFHQMGNAAVRNINRLMIAGLLKVIFIETHDGMPFLQLGIRVVNPAALALGNVHKYERNGKYHKQIGKCRGTGIREDPQETGKDHENVAYSQNLWAVFADSERDDHVETRKFFQVVIGKCLVQKFHKSKPPNRSIIAKIPKNYNLHCVFYTTF